MMGFTALIVRDCTLGLRQGGWLAQTAGFYLLAVTLFPLALGPDAGQLSFLAPGLLWIALLLATLLGLDRLFQADFEDGALDHLALSGQSLPVIVLAKAFAHWVMAGLPLLLLAPILALMLGLPWASLPVLLGAFAAGGIALTFIGAFGSALMLLARRNGALLALLLFPLYIPVLILGVGAVEAALTGRDAFAHLAALGGLALLSLALAPWGAAAAIRLALE